MTQRPGNKAGFSFAELMVVIALVGILSAIAAPSILRTLPEQRLKAAARLLYADMQRLRLLAVKENTAARIRFVNSAAGQFYYHDEDNDGTFDSGEFRRDLGEAIGIGYGCGGAQKNWNGEAINPSGLPNVPLPTTTFSSTGTCNSMSVYMQGLSNPNHSCYAVTTTNYGMVKIRRFNGISWDKN